MEDAVLCLSRLAYVPFYILLGVLMVKQSIEFCGSVFQSREGKYIHSNLYFLLFLINSTSPGLWCYDRIALFCRWSMDYLSFLTLPSLVFCFPALLMPRLTLPIVLFAHFLIPAYNRLSLRYHTLHFT